MTTRRLAAVAAAFCIAVLSGGTAAWATDGPHSAHQESGGAA